MCLQNVYAISKVFDVTLRSCGVSAFWYYQDSGRRWLTIVLISSAADDSKVSEAILSGSWKAYAYYSALPPPDTQLTILPSPVQPFHPY